MKKIGNCSCQLRFILWIKINTNIYEKTMPSKRAKTNLKIIKQLSAIRCLANIFWKFNNFFGKKIATLITIS